MKAKLIALGLLAVSAASVLAAHRARWPCTLHDIAVRLEETPMMIRLISCAAALMLLVVAAPAAAQSSMSDRDLLNSPHSGGLSHQDRNRYDELNAESTKHLRGADQAPGQKLPHLPPVPVERNVLLGSWRVEGGGQGGAGTGLGQQASLIATIVHLVAPGRTSPHGANS